jgi:hypothetical protein
MRRITMLVVCTLALALCAGVAMAQEPPDTLKVDYFANANSAGAPDGTYRITNPGTAGGSLCAAIFVYDPSQELTECCECFVSPDGLRTLSVNTDLTGNPLTGVILTTGVVKIVSTPTKGGTCPLLPVSLAPVAGIRSWGTHVQNGSFAITETASQDATLSAAELKRLTGQCYGIQLDGSKKGVCTCGTGD